MNMKKLLIVVLAFVFVLSLGACGTKTDDNNAADDNNTSIVDENNSVDENDSADENDSSDEAEDVDDGEFDIHGEGKQTVSEERATVETLQAAMDWQEGLPSDEKFALTYEDYKAQIGCDASEYEWNGLGNYGTYFWYASDDDGVSFHPTFKDGDGVLFAGGSNGLSF